MMKNKFKKNVALMLLASTLLFGGCTPEERAMTAGVALGVIASSVYTQPLHNNRPYYYSRGRYYYGGYYSRGYYHYHGRRYHNGYYYNDGYRYRNGRRYRVASNYRSRYYKNKHRSRDNNYYNKETRDVRRSHATRYR